MSRFEEVKSIVENKLIYKTEKRDYEELSEELFGEGNCFNSSEVRKRMYGMKTLLEILEEEGMNNLSENEILSQIEEKRLELEKEKIRFQDQRREYRKLQRPEARFENLVNVLEEELKNVEPVNFEVDTYELNSNQETTEAVLMASDWHIDAKFENCLAEYNIDIAKRRVNDLLNRTIKYCKLNNVETLHLELLGDNISGGIHWSSKIEAEEDVISQVITLSEILSDFIVKLCENIPNVKVYSVIGNHSRVNMSKDNNQKGENLERLIPFYLKARLSNVNNVEIMEQNNLDYGIIMFDVLNTKIIGVHGDLDSPNNVVDNMIKMFRVFPDEIHLGHRHHHFEKEEFDIEVNQNGCLQSTDTYAFNVRKSGMAMQKLCIYNTDGKLCTYKIKLK